MDGSDRSDMSVEAVQVKEECEWTNSAEWWDVSEAAARAGLYADHAVKRELVLGPEVLHQPIVMLTDDEATRTNSDLSDRGTCHWDHTYAKTETPPPEVHVKEAREEWKILGGVEEWFPLTECSVRLERIQTHDMLVYKPHWGTLPHSTSTTHVGNKSNAAKIIFSNIKVTAEENYACPICRKIFALKSQLREHVVVHIHVPTRPKRIYYACPICRKTYTLMSRLRRHVVVHIHTPTSPERGERCQADSGSVLGAPSLPVARSPRRARKRKRTKRTEATRTEFFCEMCDLKFETFQFLWEHGRVHTFEKPYICETCGKQFTKTTNAQQDSLISELHKPKLCGVCIRKLRCQRFKMYIDKQYACNICEEKFNTLWSLQCHKTIHKGEKRFRCDTCNKTFTSIHTLNIHISMF